MHALSDVRGALRSVGERLGKQREAEAAAAAIDAAIANARAHPVAHVRVLAVIDREAGGLGNTVAAGPGSWLDELLAVVGAENVLAASPARYPKLALETLLRVHPDVILDVSGQNLDAWKQLEGARSAALPQQLFGGPTPRVAQALDELARVLRDH
jgi:iron complex transport system substrate-binding protein